MPRDWRKRTARSVHRPAPEWKIGDIEAEDMAQQLMFFEKMQDGLFTNTKGMSFPLKEVDEILFLPLNRSPSLFVASYENWSEAVEEVKERMKPLLGEDFPYDGFTGILTGRVYKGR